MAKKRSKKRNKTVHKQSKLSSKKYIKLKARNLPVVKTYVSEEIFDSGIGYGVVIREKRNGEKIVGAYLLDVWCLGIKNIIYDIFEEDDLESFIFHLTETTELIECDASYVYNLIYGALEYAEDLGFDPHKDFDIAEYILPHVDEVEYIDISFGKEGKPTFVNGPSDNVGRILSTLRKSVGEGNFEYIVGVVDEMDYDGFEDGPEDNFDDVLDSQVFKEYAGMTFIIRDIYENDFDRLKSDYLKDGDVVEQSIIDFLKKKNNDESMELSEAEKNIAFACAENLIMYRDVQYLMQPQILGSFRSGGPMDILNSIVNVSITNYGDQKLEVLCNLLLEMENNGATDNAVKFIDDSLKLIELNHNSVFEKYSYEAFTALAALHLHVSTFGNIDYSRIELKAID